MRGLPLTQLDPSLDVCPNFFVGYDDEVIPPCSFIETLNKIIEKWPHQFDVDLLKQYHRYLALSEKEFRAHRSKEHQLRIICSHYLMQKSLIRQKQGLSDEINIELRLLPTRLNFPFGYKPVLGIAIAIQLSSSYERFEDSHILLAIQKFLPKAEVIKESLYTFQKASELLRLLYIEVEKPLASSFSLEEIGLLKRELKEEFKRHVETLCPSIFGFEDTEQTMRNIFSLGQQVQSPSDLPQGMISFQRALETTLVFHIIIVRPLKGTSRTLAESFQKVEGLCEYVHERTSTIGYLNSNQEIAKEASVFRLQIPKKPFLMRSDSSFNFYRARAHVLFLLTQALGEVRDFNGGIFSKQQELFAQFKTHFTNIAEKDPEVLEDFFYGLKPPEIQAIISLSSLVALFELFIEAFTGNISSKKRPVLKIKQENNLTFIIVQFEDNNFQAYIKSTLDKSQISKDLTAWVSTKYKGNNVLGYIFPASCPEKQQQFYHLLKKAIEIWLEEKQSTQVLRLSPQHLPVSVDPRLGGDEISAVFLKMLFEGLTRIGKDGRPSLAIAKNVEILDEGRRYVFKLRECKWNNGDLITAHDFSHAWKKILTPNFSSAFANLFYIILNAKKAKEGLVSLDEIGVQAPDDQTLIVDLEYPCSYFLELTAHPLYSPVSHRIDCIHPNWSLQTGSSYVCNGPFELEHSDRQEYYELKKNTLYWDQNEVKLERIQISRGNSRESLEMFTKGEVDWLGRPLNAWEPFFSECQNIQMEELPSSSSYWYVFNVKQFPFQSVKMRQAFARAINREEIINLLSYAAAPAFTPLPFSHTRFPNLKRSEKFRDPKSLFEEALHEMKLSRQNLPPLILTHTNNELRKKIAWIIIQQWRELLGIVVEMKSYSFKRVFKKMTQGDYQIGVMSWLPKIDDPTYTLSAFKNSNELINFSKWENNTYKYFLERANQEVCFKKRNHFLARAEAILIKEAPVIPIFHEKERFLRQNYVEGIYPSKVGSIDFKHAYINKKCKNLRSSYG